MFKIGEFSKLTQVTVRMLRYYDKMGLLKPAQIDPWTGYRMYSADQIPILNKIIYLRDSGFQVAEIVQILKNEDSSEMARQLDKKYLEIKKAMKEEQEKLKKIELAQKELLSGQGEMHYQVLTKSIPSYQVLSLRRVIPNYYAEGELWKELSEFAGREKAAVSNDTFSIYHDLEYKEEQVDVELCALVEKPGKDKGDFTYRCTEAVPVMAYTMAYGPFSNIAGAYLAFAGWLQGNETYRMIGKSRQIVHRGPWNEADPAKYLIEIQIPLETMG